MKSHSTASDAERRAPRSAFARLAAAALLLSCARAPTRLVFRVLGENLVPAWCDEAPHRGTAACPASAYRLVNVLVRVCHNVCTSPDANECVGDELFCRSFVDALRRSPQTTLPGDVTAAPADPEVGSRVTVVVVAAVRVPGAGGATTTERIRRRFVVPFVRESTQLVEVWLSSLCIGVECPPETSCGRRSCEPVENPPTRPFTSLPGAGPVDGGDLDAHFDVVQRDARADAADVMDVTNATDVTGAADVTDVTDVRVALDASDVRDVADAVDANDAAAPVDVAGDMGAPVDVPGGCRVCPRATECCGTMCIDTSTSATNCGACGVTCAPGMACCAGACIDVLGDVNNCGACGAPCARVEGCCNGACTNTLTSATHCGRCDISCTVRNFCCEGLCTRTTDDAGRCGDAGG